MSRKRGDQKKGGDITFHDPALEANKSKFWRLNTSVKIQIIRAATSWMKTVDKYALLPELTLSQREFVKASCSKDGEALVNMQTEIEKNLRTILEIGADVGGEDPQHQELLSK